MVLLRNVLTVLAGWATAVAAVPAPAPAPGPNAVEPRAKPGLEKMSLFWSPDGVIALSAGATISLSLKQSMQQAGFPDVMAQSLLNSFRRWSPYRHGVRTSQQADQVLLGAGAGGLFGSIDLFWWARFNRFSDFGFVHDTGLGSVDLEIFRGYIKGWAETFGVAIVETQEQNGFADAFERNPLRRKAKRGFGDVCAQEVNVFNLDLAEPDGGPDWSQVSGSKAC